MSNESTASIGDRLTLVGDLFKALDRARIPYVHWKSNEHLDAALRGETDLDLLVSRDHRGDFETMVADAGFVAVDAPRLRRVPGMQAYLGFDSESGRLVHLDVHYDLVMGERLIKNHHLPIEGWLFEDPGSLLGVPVPTPEKEFILLYVRSVLKTGPKQFLRSAMRGGSPFPERIQKEMAWLARRVTDDALERELAGAAVPVQPGAVVEFKRRVESGGLDWRWVLRQRVAVWRALRHNRRHRGLQALLRRAVINFRSSRLGRRLGFGLKRRTLQSRGLVVALVGADGAGKSRIASDVGRWLGAKLEVEHVYFGQPKSGLLYLLLAKPGSLVRNRGIGVLKPVAEITDALRWVAIAARRRRLAERARRKASEGGVVIAERYPLREFFSMETPMDGPRLHRQRGLLGLPRMEVRLYERIPRPDFTIVLRTDIDTLRARKLDLALDEHLPKVEAIASLEPGDDLEVVDAGRPYEEVLQMVKSLIWSRLA
jgi:thymidylate kinase